MGSEFWKQPAKRLDREFRGMGATRVERNSKLVAYRFPDGARHEVPANIGPGHARMLLIRLQGIYGHSPQDPLDFAEKRAGAPTIDLARVVASKHAMIRFDQMRASAGLTYQEMLLALRAPSKVLWSSVHESWMWVGDRICVAASITPNGQAVIRTILWTTEELWAENPRPEQVRACAP